MPIALAYAAVALGGVIILGIIANKILAHLDGTAASDAYSKSLLQREQSLLNLTKAGVPFSQAAGQLGPPPKQPKGMGLGLPVVLVGSGIAVAIAAIFWKPILGIFRKSHVGGSA